MSRKPKYDYDYLDYEAEDGYEESPGDLVKRTPTTRRSTPVTVTGPEFAIQMSLRMTSSVLIPCWSLTPFYVMSMAR